MSELEQGLYMILCPSELLKVIEFGMEMQMKVSNNFELDQKLHYMFNVFFIILFHRIVNNSIFKAHSQ